MLYINLETYQVLASFTELDFSQAYVFLLMWMLGCGVCIENNYPSTVMKLLATSN